MFVPPRQGHEPLRLARRQLATDRPGLDKAPRTNLAAHIGDDLLVTDKPKLHHKESPALVKAP